LNQVITGMRNLLTRLIGENVELHTELADDLKLVKTDPAQLQQVILNLVLNARDAMPDGGKVTLKTRNLQPVTPVGGDQSAWSIEVEVRDTGCGMDEETRARVFEPFFTTKKPGKGSGLGLATVHSIVENDGGTINLESDLGKGTRVVIRLPAAESEAQPTRVAGVLEVPAASAPGPSEKVEHQERRNQL
jgi:two-component system, cell cycle sensor histidine kinase and response regulator CckA